MVSTPSPPDPYKQAAAQQSSDLFATQASAVANNPNETNPYGAVQYTTDSWNKITDASGKTSYVPRYNRNVTLSPDQQKLLGLQTQAQGNAGQAAVTASAGLANQFKTSLDPSGWQAWNAGQAPQDVRQDQGPTDRAGIQDAMMARYKEQAGKANSAEDAQLAARGLSPGGQGYGQAADVRARGLTDATNQAYLASGGEARAAQDAYNKAGAQQYSQGQDYASANNNLRQAQQTSATALRNQLPNEVGALMGMGQVTTPQFAPFSRQGVNAAPVGQYMQDAYQSQVQNASAANQGLFGRGSAGLGLFKFASDRRLKQDIEPTGGQLAGAPLYWFRYRAHPEEIHVGVMADEVRPLHPDAVVEMGGYDAVDYGLLRERENTHG
jgi:hypothetical protein